MKILVTVHGFLTPSMTFVYNQINAFKSEGHTVKIIACEIINEDIFPCEGVVRIKQKKDVSSLISKTKRVLALDFTLYNSYFTERFKQEVESFEPDVVHVHFGLQLIRIYPAVKDLDVPVVTTFHGYDASKYLRNKSYVKKLHKILSRKNMFATTVSEDMRNRLKAHSIDVSRTNVDYLGVDTKFFDPEAEDQDRTEKVFLQVSNFVEKKGHEYTIRAFVRHLKSSDSQNERLVLAGDGPLFSQIKELVSMEGISEHVDFPGLVDKHGVKKLMQNADYFVHHSITAKDGDMEGLPTVLMEAMAMGLPVLSTYHAGISELIDSPDQGILVEEKDIESYARALGEIKNCQARTSRQRILSNFNLDENTKNILGIFKRITDER